MKRTVISVSVSERNPDAVIVAEALVERGIPLTCSGGQILAWAAAYLSGPPPEPQPVIDQLGMTEGELDDLLDKF